MSHAEARHRTYGLLGQVWAQGLVPETAAILRQLPALSGLVGPDDPDAWAVAHQALFGRQVAAYESVFRDANDMAALRTGCWSGATTDIGTEPDSGPCQRSEAVQPPYQVRLPNSANR